MTPSKSSLPLCPTIVQWEEAGASLVSAFGNYMNLCVNLGTVSLRERANPKDLVSRIDSTLARVHTVISHHLGESSSALARTRNKLASPLFCFPEEILSEIFMNVVFDRNDRRSSKPPSVERGARMVYRRLYNLLGVCSVWKDLVLARGGLWSVIPIIEGQSDKKHKAVKLILRRAGGSPLHLATSMTWSAPSRLIKVITEYGSRLRTINLSASSRYVIRDIIHMLLQHSTPGSLSELSLHFSNTSLVNRLPNESDYIFPRDHLDYDSFTGLVGRLTALRICGIHFHWDIISSSARLVELRIEQLALGYDDAIIPFVRALSSAPNLRDLKIISVSTFRDLNTTHNQDSSVQMTFPNLESLLLQDLYFNTLECLLPIISPGSYRLTLFLTRKSLESNVLRDDILENEDQDDMEVELVDVSELGSALAGTPVHTLVMVGIWDECWLTGPELRTLLIAMPTVKTLKMSNWDLDRSVWRALRRSPAARSRPDDPLFPALENLHFYSAMIINQRGFKNMVASHPIQTMVLGAGLPNTAHELSEWDSCDEDDSIAGWLKVGIPSLLLVSSTYVSPEFHSDVWQLW